MHTGDTRLHKQTLDGTVGLGVVVLEVENVEMGASVFTLPPAEKIINVRQTNIKFKKQV